MRLLRFGPRIDLVAIEALNRPERIVAGRERHCVYRQIVFDRGDRQGQGFRALQANRRDTVCIDRNVPLRVAFRARDAQCAASGRLT